MPVPPTPLPAELGAEFACARAIAAGASRRRLRARDLEAPFRGVRVRGAADEHDGSRDAEPEPLARDRAERARVLALATSYAQVMEPHAFFAARTAAVIHGVPLRHGADIDVAVFAPARAPRRRGVRGIKVSPGRVEVREHAGLRLVRPADAWAMLAIDSSVRDLVVAGDALVRVPRDAYGRPLPDERIATIDDLRAAIEAGRRRGIVKLREAIDLVRVGSSSPLETDFRLAADAARLPAADLDVEIRDARGRLLGISEFVYPDYLTIVEIEGDHHRTSRQQWNRDIEKYSAYAAAGWEVVRLTSAHVRGGGPNGVATVRRVLRRRGWAGA